MRPLVLSRFWYMATISALLFPRNFSGSTVSLSAEAGDSSLEVGAVEAGESVAVTASRSAESAVSELPGRSSSDETMSARLVTFQLRNPRRRDWTAAGYGAGWKAQDREKISREAWPSLVLTPHRQSRGRHHSRRDRGVACLRLPCVAGELARSRQCWSL